MSKGYDGYIVVREGNGWGSTTSREGFALFADSIDMGPNKEFKERPEKLVLGRGMKSEQRTSGASKPGGSIDFQPRSDDFPLILMSHCQMYEGTVSASVATYTFVNTKGQPDFAGATYGSGSYSTAAGDMFVVDIWKNFESPGDGVTANTERYESAFVDELTLNAAANEDLKVTAVFKSNSYATKFQSGAQQPDSSLGSYSNNSMFEFFSGTMTIAGDTTSQIDLTSFNVTSKNAAEDRIVIGKLNPSKYPFGRIAVEGEFTMDMPDDGLKHMGSMLDNETFSITGTFFNSDDDMIAFDMPLCKRENFSVNQSGGEETNEMSIPYKAYESLNGNTAPITWTVRTTGLGSAFEIV